jgi:hypothetical protein
VEPNGEPMNENFILLQIFAAGQKEGRKRVTNIFGHTRFNSIFFYLHNFFFVLNI